MKKYPRGSGNGFGNGYYVYGKGSGSYGYEDGNYGFVNYPMWQVTR